MGHLGILPDSTLIADEVTVDASELTIRSHSGCVAARCPLCQTPSSRVQSRYVRTLTDLPAHGLIVHLELTVRRFVCLCADCPRKIFAERFPAATVPHSPYTTRLNGILGLLGLGVGGEPGARLAARLSLPTSPDTLLRKARRAAKGHSVVSPRQLGVDDFALRRGQRYGTILVDLEQHRPIDLIAGRSAEGLGDWLRQRTGIEILSRDRSSAYAQAASQHAPDAVQVADRFHLLKNIAETLERILARHQRDLKVAAEAANAPSPDERAIPALPDQTSSAEPQTQAIVSAPLATSTGSQPAALVSPSKARQNQERAARRQRRLDRYTQVHDLFARGFTQRAIARHLRLSRNTIRRFLRVEEFPERAAAKRRSEYERFVAYLRTRWDEGVHNSTQLWGELRELGYRGQVSRLRQVLSTWRDPEGRPRGRKATRAGQTSRPALDIPSPRQTTWFLLKPENLEPDQEKFRRSLLEACGVATKAEDLGRAFFTLVRSRNADGLDDWLAKAKASGIEEFRSFVRGIERDKAAVIAALTLSVSNGQVEGQVTRLKLIKRMMYGRGKLDLLCARVVHGP
jgi:transposase